MTSLKALKVTLKNRIISYFESDLDSDSVQDYPELVAEVMLNKYPRDYSNFRRKNFKKFVCLVRYSLEEINLNNHSKDDNSTNDNRIKKYTFNGNDDSFSDDDFSMPESTHNLNDLVTSSFQKPTTPKLSEFFTIDKTGDNSLKRKDSIIEIKPCKKIKSEDEFCLKTQEIKNAKTAKSKKQSTSNKDIAKVNFEVINPELDFSVLDGMDDVITKIKFYLQCYSLCHNKLMRRGFLLSGSAGTGKTTLGKCIAHELQMPMVVASSSQLLNGLPSEQGENVDRLFEQALSLEPCFVLIEKIELFMNDSKEHSTSSSLSEILIKNIDDLNSKDSDVWLIATTSKVENVDPQLLKGRRFEKTFHLPLPNLSKRVNLIRRYMDAYLTTSESNMDVVFNKTSVNLNIDHINLETQNDKKLTRTKRPVIVRLSDACTMQQLAEKTPSFSAPDLKILVEEALLHCFNNQQLSNDTDTMVVEVGVEDFEKALSLVKPSTMSEYIGSVPEVTWDSIGALGSIRDDLSWLILKPIKHPELFEKDCLPLQGGVMLYGPPGCGKTLIAKAIANEACLNFISVAGPELKDKYVGESEKNIRILFRRAQECAPCLIFFDEIDSICSTRGFGSETAGGINVVQQMLTELDGVRERKAVYVMGATNRIDQVDPAFLRENRCAYICCVLLRQYCMY